MKKLNGGKFLSLVFAFIIVSSIAVDAALVGTSRDVLSDTQKECTGNLVGLYGTSGTGRLRVKSDNGMSVKAEAMQVVLYWFDKKLKEKTTSSTSWSSWTPDFDLKEVNVGYYVKVSGSKEAMGRGEFEVYQ